MPKKSDKKSKSTEKFLAGNLKWLHEEKKIWLNPDYQREEVWTKAQKQLLIDSLLFDIDIPKMYYREVDKDSYEYEVVDGQQRLRAIFDFMDDKFKMPSKAAELDGHRIRGLAFTDLDVAIQMRLRNVPLDVVVLNA